MADKYNSKFAKFTRWLNGMPEDVDWAITIGENTTLFSCGEEDVDEKWRKHENIHKEQFKRMGWFWFLLSYIYEYIVHGYDNNKYEIEARGE